MQRRNFMAGLATVPLAAGAGLAQANHLYWKPFRETDDVALSSPHAAWKNSFHRVPTSYESRVPMRIPEGLRGVLYRNGPALMTLGGTRYRHWLDGDGMVHAFRFDGGALRHHARMVATNKLTAELKAGRRTAPGFGTSLPGTAVVGRDDMNTANTHTLMVNGELWALWEGGAPYVMNPETLATVGRKNWSPEVDSLPFSAHPRVDASGNVWSFGYLPGSGNFLPGGSAISVRQLNASGAMVRHAFVPAPNSDMVHDFAITERYLVFVLMPYRFDSTLTDPSLSFIGHYQWGAGQPATVLVVDKATLNVVRRIDIPTVSLFHLGNAWEHGNTLRFAIVNYRDFSEVMNKLGTAMDRAAMSWPESRWTEFEVDLAAGTVRTWQPYADTVEFPHYDLRRTGRETRYAYMMASRHPAAQPLFGMNVVRAVDHKTERMQEYDYGQQVVAEEHVFVPAPGSDVENRGWLIGTAFDWKQRRTLVSIFNAERVQDGPMEQVALPYGVPLGIHGRFHAS